MHSLLGGALALLAIALAGEVAAQQLPAGPSAVPQLRRGADGQLEVVPEAPPAPAPPATSPPPAATAKPAAKIAEPAPSARPAKAPEQRPAATASAPPPASPPLPAAAPPAATVSVPAEPPPPAAPRPETRAATILLPEPLAIELPKGQASLAPDAPATHELLDAAKSEGRIVTDDLSHAVEVGPVPVTWSAWDGRPGTGKPALATRATVLVLPFGLAPVGLSGDENATAGNNATKIARNAKGDRVHMVWIDGGRPGHGTPVMYRRAVVANDGTIRWETGPVEISDAKTQAWNAYPGLAVAGETVYVAWQAAGHVIYRRLDVEGGSLKWDAIRDLGVASDGRDIGPSVSAHDKTVHIATPSGIDIVSADAGATWQPTPIPLPPGRKIKTVSVDLDSSNQAHFAMSTMVRGPEHPSTEAASRGYWELRSISRAPDGTWGKSENILEARPEWAEPSGQDDVLADWARILVDGANALHVTWHGTAVSRIYGNDRSYYDYRPRGAATWEKPALLVPTSDIPGSRFSFAPSLALGQDVVVALTFYDVYDGARWGGFDALARMLRGGKLDGQPLPVSQWVHASIQSHRPEIALSARFPSAAPTLFYAPDGRIWLDVLETLIPMGIPDAQKLIAYQRVDITSWLDGKSPAQATVAERPQAAPAALATADKPPEPGTVLFTLRDLLSYVPTLIGRL